MGDCGGREGCRDLAGSYRGKGGLNVRVRLPFSILSAVFLSLSFQPGYGQSPAFPVLREGTPVMLQLDQTVSSRTARMGQRVAFEVTEDVSVDGRVVVPSGSVALGTVTEASRNLWIAHAGHLSVHIDAVRLPGGQAVPLSTVPDAEENDGGADDPIATSLISPPVAPEFPVRHRRETLIPEGTQLRAFVRRDTVVAVQTASVSN